MCRQERRINFRIVNSIGVGTGGFHTEECPKGHMVMEFVAASPKAILFTW